MPAQWERQALRNGGASGGRHARSSRAPNGGTSRCQAGNGFGRSSRRRSSDRVVACGPLGRRAWDADVRIGRTGIVASLHGMRVQRTVLPPLTPRRTAYGIVRGATALRYLAWPRATQATRRHELGRCCCGPNLAVDEVAARSFEPSFGRGRARPVVLSVAPELQSGAVFRVGKVRDSPCASGRPVRRARAGSSLRQQAVATWSPPIDPVAVGTPTSASGTRGAERVANR